MLFRHGDVLIMQIDELPADVVLLAVPILAYGEVTGHAHRIEDPRKAEVWQSTDQLYLRVIDVTRVVHEEHQPIELQPGYYRVWQQREYVPPTERADSSISYRAVRD